MNHELWVNINPVTLFTLKKGNRIRLRSSKEEGVVESIDRYGAIKFKRDSNLCNNDNLEPHIVDGWQKELKTGDRVIRHMKGEHFNPSYNPDDGNASVWVVRSIDQDAFTGVNQHGETIKASAEFAEVID